MSLYDDIRDGLKRALVLNEKVAALDRTVQGLAHDLMRVSDRVQEIDKRLVRIETMADMSVGTRPRLESKE